jgi:hypothetical protein
MFPENGEDSSRSFAWQHFLAAMTDAGFSILQSQGSAVTLKLEKSQGVYDCGSSSSSCGYHQPNHVEKHCQEDEQVVWLG